MCHDWQLGHMQVQDARRTGERVKREESILPENKHGWMQGKQEQPSSSRHKRAVLEEWDHPPEKFWRMGEEDVAMRQEEISLCLVPALNRGSLR